MSELKLTCHVTQGGGKHSHIEVRNHLGVYWEFTAPSAEVPALVARIEGRDQSWLDSMMADPDFLAGYAGEVLSARNEDLQAENERLQNEVLRAVWQILDRIRALTALVPEEATPLP